MSAFLTVLGGWLRGERGYWKVLGRTSHPESLAGEPASTQDPEDEFRRPPIADPELRAFSLLEEPGDSELRRGQRLARRWPIRPGFDLVSRSLGASIHDLETSFESLRQQIYDDWIWDVETPLEWQAAVDSLASAMAAFTRSRRKKAARL